MLEKTSEHIVNGNEHRGKRIAKTHALYVVNEWKTRKQTAILYSILSKDSVRANMKVADYVCMWCEAGVKPKTNHEKYMKNGAWM